MVEGEGWMMAEARRVQKTIESGRGKRRRRRARLERVGSKGKIHSQDGI